MNLLNFVGVGEVMENKPSNSSWIYVSLKRDFPQMDGALKSMAKILTTSNTGDGNGYQSSKVLESNFHPAKWIGMEGNRITSPDVIVGSKVAIYKFSDDDTYLWTTWGIGTESFRLEHIVYAWNANPNFDKDTPFTFDDYYTLIFSTRDKHITLKTTQANGEPAAYNLTLDTNNARYSLSDTERNVFALDSMKHVWLMKNWEGSIFTINRENVSIINKGTQLFEADKAIFMKTKDMTIRCQTLDIEAANSLSMKTASMAVNATKVNWESTKIDITCPQSDFIGNVGIAGNLGVGGGISCFAGPGGAGGSLETSGGIIADETIESKGDIIASGLSLLRHVHTDSKGGSTSTGK